MEKRERGSGKGRGRKRHNDVRGKGYASCQRMLVELSVILVYVCG